MSIPAYRLLARIKNNRLWRSIEINFGPQPTQRAAADVLHVRYATLVSLLSMKYWPGCGEKRVVCSRCREGWHAIAWILADKLRETPEYLFAPELYGRAPIVPLLSLEFDRPALEATGVLGLNPAPDSFIEEEELQHGLARALASLSPREQTVLKLHFGFDGPPQTLDSVGEQFRVSPSRIQQIEAKALRKLRHPVRIKRLTAYR